MLILTRKPSQSLVVQPHPNLAPGTPFEEVFADGLIQVQVLAMEDSQVRLGVEAPSGFCVCGRRYGARC